MASLASAGSESSDRPSRDADPGGGPDVSVIVPFANAAPFIERTIEALLAQRYPRERYEIVMVDNNSGDGSLAIARRYPGVTLLSEPRRGAYAARNRALADAAGSLVAFTDADCAPAPGWLSAITGALEDRHVGVALGRVINPPSRSLALLAAYEHQRARYVFDSRNPELYYGYTNNMGVRRALLDSLGPFDPVARGADMVFVHRVASALGPDSVRYAPDALVEHLEMTGARVWLRKMFIYGRSSRYYRPTRATRTLDGSERRVLFLRTVREQQCGLADRARLLALLAAGVALYRVGRWSAAQPRHA